MPRTIYFLILLGATALPTLLPGETPPPGNNPETAAPDNGVPPPTTGQAVTPAPSLGTQPSNNVVENGAPRGSLGSLASGAPGVAEKLPAPAVGGGTPGVAATAPAAVGTVQKTTVVEQRPASKIPQEILVMEAMGHCFFDAMRQAHQPGFAGPVMIGGGFPFPAPPAGDLKLISVQQLSGAPAEPPLYRVTFRNDSRFPAKGFHVAAIATQGRILPASPIVSAEIEELAAGGVGHLDLRVPAAALTLGPTNAPVPFSSLVVVLDSLNVLSETNEWNNVAEFGRTEIVAIEVTETAAAPAAAPAASAQPAPATAPAAPATTPAAPMTPQAMPDSGNNQVPLDEIDEAAALLKR